MLPVSVSASSSASARSGGDMNLGPVTFGAVNIVPASKGYMPWLIGGAVLLVIVYFWKFKR